MGRRWGKSKPQVKQQEDGSKDSRKSSKSKPQVKQQEDGNKESRKSNKSKPGTPRVKGDKGAQPDGDEGGTYCCGYLEGNKERGGRLRKLLLYDTFCFVISGVLFLGILVLSKSQGIRHHDMHVHAKQALFWCRIFYSLWSLPFVVFVIPGLCRILTHTTVTGYNTKGACVEFAYDPPQITLPVHAKAG